MRKFLIVLGLLAVIISSFSYIILKALANGSEDNFFNKQYRAKFAAVPFFRSIIGLHFDGDGKADYLGSRYKKILIEVDEMEGLDLPKPAVDLLAEKIHAVTGKEVEVVYSDVIPLQSSVNDQDIKKIVGAYRNVNFVSGTAKIYLLYLTEYGDDITQLGSTHDEYGIVLYDSALRTFTKSSPATFSNYVESTALHEFGHQMGLPHNNQPNCLMLAHAEESHVVRENPSDVLVDFCDYEKQLIDAEKLKLK